MVIESWLVLAGISRAQLAELVRRLPEPTRRGRPPARSVVQRVLLTCVALRTNLTVRELAALARISKSTAHRTIATMKRRLAACTTSPLHDHRFSWGLDGTLVPTRDHRRAAKSKNYRWSCNAQRLIRRCDLAVVASSAGGPGNRNDPVHYRGSALEPLCQAHLSALSCR